MAILPQEFVTDLGGGSGKMANKYAGCKENSLCTSPLSKKAITNQLIALKREIAWVQILITNFFGSVFRFFLRFARHYIVLMIIKR
jgi:hypothetical protein